MRFRQHVAAEQTVAHNQVSSAKHRNEQTFGQNFIFFKYVTDRHTLVKVVDEA